MKKVSKVRIILALSVIFVVSCFFGIFQQTKTGFATNELTGDLATDIATNYSDYDPSNNLLAIDGLQNVIGSIGKENAYSVGESYNAQTGVLTIDSNYGDQIGKKITNAYIEAGKVKVNGAEVELKDQPILYRATIKFVDFYDQTWTGGGLAYGFVAGANKSLVTRMDADGNIRLSYADNFDPF